MPTDRLRKTRKDRRRSRPTFERDVSRVQNRIASAWTNLLGECIPNYTASHVIMMWIHSCQNVRFWIILCAAVYVLATHRTILDPTFLMLNGLWLGCHSAVGASCWSRNLPVQTIIVNGVLRDFLRNENSQLTKTNLLWLNRNKKQSHGVKIVSWMHVCSPSCLLKLG